MERTYHIILPAIISKPLTHVMLAEDDPDDRTLFVEVMQEIVPDVTVSVSQNGQDLMDQLASSAELPDVIFLDLNMPLKNGFQCLEEIRSSERLKAIPVIICSTSSSPEHITDTFIKGANFYFSKPSSFKDFKNIIRQVFDFNLTGYATPPIEKFVLRVNKTGRPL